MANNYRENKTSTPQPNIQHNISFEDAMTCDVAPELLDFYGHTIITLCGSRVINFPLPLLSCHADTKFTPRKLNFHECVVEFFKNNQLNQKGMNWSEGTKHCSFTIDIECIIYSLALMWTATDYVDPHQAP